MELDPSEDEDEKPRKSKKVKADKATASTPIDAHRPDSPAEYRKEKKRKHAGGEDISEARQGVEEPKKKKKKRKHEGEAVGEEDDLQTKGDGSGRKKRRKETVAVKDGEQERHQETECGDEADGDLGGDDQFTLSKRDKKDKKKRKELEGGEGEKGKKTRKRSSASGCPDPTKDESLSGQARKALQYAFTQFEDPVSWKFNKARQNWLIRNIWSDETIPEKYMVLATRYLQGVQGGAREVLIKTCRQAAESPKSDADVAEREDISTESPEAQGQIDPHTKQTVRFIAETNSDIPTPNEAKRQRAAVLLTALTPL